MSTNYYLQETAKPTGWFVAPKIHMFKRFGPVVTIRGYHKDDSYDFIGTVDSWSDWEHILVSKPHTVKIVNEYGVEFSDEEIRQMVRSCSVPGRESRMYTVDKEQFSVCYEDFF